MCFVLKKVRNSLTWFSHFSHLAFHIPTLAGSCLWQFSSTCTGPRSLSIWCCCITDLVPGNFVVFLLKVHGLSQPLTDEYIKGLVSKDNLRGPKRFILGLYAPGKKTNSTQVIASPLSPQRILMWGSESRPNSPRSLDLDDRQGLIARSAMQQKKKKKNMLPLLPSFGCTAGLKMTMNCWMQHPTSTCLSPPQLAALLRIWNKLLMTCTLPPLNRSLLIPFFISPFPVCPSHTHGLSSPSTSKTSSLSWIDTSLRT